MAGQAKASSSSSDYHNTTAGSPITYDVFLNFRGDDTRKGFTGHLYHALSRERVRVFMDSYQLWKGEDIGSELLNSIQSSKISIPIFSVDYAASKWCLKELVKISECHKFNNQIVLPIFFHVDPSTDVRHQNGSFEQAFLEHEKNLDPHEVKLWRDALVMIGNLSGWVLKDVENGNESELVDRVVKEVLRRLCTVSFIDVTCHIGLDSRVKTLQSLLNTNSEDVQYIGICGIGGIGKTTIARALYHDIVKSFHQGFFLENIRKKASRDEGLVSLQKELFGSISNREVHSEIANVDSRIQMKKKLGGKKVLLILDDVDDHSQLEAFALNKKWLGQGSAVIITTRDEKILNMAHIDQGKIYRPKELDEKQSLEYSLRAFQKIKPFEDHMELSRAVAEHSGGLPLTLKVLGSCLAGVTDKEVWESKIHQFNFCPPKEVFESLKISYDNLENHFQKYTFLDSACFFVGWDREILLTIWEACHFHPKSGIERLTQMSLLRFEKSEDGRCYLRMHDQIRSMGKQIVSSESLGEPGKRSRLWSDNEILDVLEGNRVTDNIEGIVLPANLSTPLTVQHFKMMSKLRILISNSKSFPGDFCFSWLPYSLICFRWNSCIWDVVPSNCHHRRLVYLDLSCSMIKQAWISSPREENKFQNLRVLNLSHCGDLCDSPSFLWFPCLERLDLGYCIKLRRLDESIGELCRLKSLNLECCDSLRELPATIGNMTSLAELKLRNITKIKELPGGVRCFSKSTDGDGVKAESPDGVGKSPGGGWLWSTASWGMGMVLKSWAELNLRNIEDDDDHAKIESFYGFTLLEKLEELDVSGCTSLVRVPDLSMQKNLKRLNLRGCYKLEQLEEWSGGVRELPYGFRPLEELEELDFSGCTSLVRVPYLSMLKNLKRLNLRGCCKIEKLEEWPGGGVRELPDGFRPLEELEELDVSGCTSLVRVPDLSMQTNLKRLSLRGCCKLERLEGIEGAKSLENMEARECSGLTRPLKTILHKGSFLLPDEPKEFSYSLNGMYNNEGLVLCIVFEFIPKSLESEKPPIEVIYLDVSASIRQGDKTAEFHFTLRIRFFQREGNLIYIHDFGGFDWFGVPLQGKDAIDKLEVRRSENLGDRQSSLKVKFWKLLFGNPEEQMPNIKGFFTWSDVEEGLEIGDEEEYHLLSKDFFTWSNVFGEEKLEIEYEEDEENEDDEADEDDEEDEKDDDDEDDEEDEEEPLPLSGTENTQETPHQVSNIGLRGTCTFDDTPQFAYFFLLFAFVFCVRIFFWGPKEICFNL